MAKKAFKHFFSKNASVNLPRTRFDMSFTNTTTITTDYLYPVFCKMVIPGDTWNMGVSNFIRMIAPIDVPMMDNLYCDYHFWFVPMRLVWEHTKYFFGEEDRTPNSDTDYTMPQIRFDSTVDRVQHYAGWNPHAGLPQCGSIYDYMGIPIQGTDGILSGSFSISALPLRCYNLIVDDWYRDEQRVDYSYYNIGDEADTADKYFLLKRGKRFDLLTSTLLEPQLGEPVSLPLGTTAPVYGDGNGLMISNGSGNLSLVAYKNTALDVSNYVAPTAGNHALGRTFESAYNFGPGSNTYSRVLGVSTKEAMVNAGLSSGIYADLTSATASTIASLREAFQMQAYQELQARGGTRLTEFIYNQYSVIQPDILSRPEFLGGMHQQLTVQPIVQNSSTDSTSPQGNLTGIIYSAEGDHAFTRSFTEHGYIIGIMNIYADLTYFQGLDRMWSIETLFDIPLPVFANLTDEALYSKEVALTGNAEIDEKVFGYMERYAPWKYSQNTLSGLVRPNAPLTIGQWSLAEQFETVPENTADFIQSNTPIDRISAVPYEGPEGQKNPHTFIVNQKFSGNVVRTLPAYSDPMKWFMRV